MLAKLKVVLSGNNSPKSLKVLRCYIKTRGENTRQDNFNSIKRCPTKRSSKTYLPCLGALQDNLKIQVTQRAFENDGCYG